MSSNKYLLAQAITAKGVEPSEDDSILTMVENIGKIKSADGEYKLFYTYWDRSGNYDISVTKGTYILINITKANEGAYSSNSISIASGTGTFSDSKSGSGLEFCVNSKIAKITSDTATIRFYNSGANRVSNSFIAVRCD